MFDIASSTSKDVPPFLSPLSPPVFSSVPYLSSTSTSWFVTVALILSCDDYFFFLNVRITRFSLISWGSLILLCPEWLPASCEPTCSISLDQYFHQRQLFCLRTKFINWYHITCSFDCWGLVYRPNATTHLEWFPLTILYKLLLSDGPPYSQ